MKWNSPLFDEIRGSLKATNTTFRMWKGRRIAEKKPIPRQVYSHLQLYQRSLYKAALERWKSLSVDEKEYWKTEAGKIGLDGHNLYIQQYITNFGKPVSAWLFTEGAGTVLADYYGLNNGTIIDGTWQKIDNWNVLNFDGVDDYVIVPDSPSLHFNGSDSFTITAWVKFDALPSEVGNHMGIVFKDGDFLVRADIVNRVSFYVWDGTDWEPGAFPPSNSIEVGKWYFITAVYDNGTLKVYYNAELMATSSNTKDVATTNQLEFGVAFVVEFLDGIIDEVRIYNRALLPEEIAAIWQVYQKSPLFS